MIFDRHLKVHLLFFDYLIAGLNEEVKIGFACCNNQMQA